ncbi:MAG TPA: tetratricopeptide repeat protein [Candidatus Hydrogenedentes bacterium]|nr:tetratricopeptide repeat protein [Candidatus Hydrogenedentota bacterium]HOH50721.1 tetratricopeptide repeat protein [Candidatus Hydrogenedentota bacterium]HQL95701.1 tetratricopeptide repeat protein [Candidatus Hydrogenedentota bacterium]HRZ83690.1 tetratricopeptide repeat protein [Candidatus Hydrogenedentota bacterium]
MPRMHTEAERPPAGKAPGLRAAALLALAPLVLAGCYAETGRDPAYVPKTRALELHRDAVAAAAAKDYDRALTLVDAALKEDGGYGDAALTRAVVLAQSGKLEESAAAYAAVAQQWADHPEAHVMRGIVLEKLGRRDEADEAYARGLAGFEARTADRPKPREELMHALTVYLHRGDSAGLVAFNALLGKYPDYQPAMELKQRVLKGDRGFVMTWLEEPGR